MVASVGAEVGILTVWLRNAMVPSPMDRPRIAVSNGIPMAMAVPNVNSKMTTAAARPTTTESWVAGLETFWPRYPPAAGFAERTRGLRDRRVLRIGFDDPLDGLFVFEIREFVAFGGPQGDRDRAVGLVGELVAEQVARGLAVGSRQREVVVRILADGFGHEHDRDGDHHPDREDHDGVTGAKVTKTIEQWRQRVLPVTWRLIVALPIVSSTGSSTVSIHRGQRQRITQMS